MFSTRMYKANTGAYGLYLLYITNSDYNIKYKIYKIYQICPECDI